MSEKKRLFLGGLPHGTGWLSVPVSLIFEPLHGRGARYTGDDDAVTAAEAGCPRDRAFAAFMASISGRNI